MTSKPILSDKMPVLFVGHGNPMNAITDNSYSPCNEHYLPLMYALGLRDRTDTVQFFNESFDLGSLSMRSVLFS